ncbi:MAG: hypothetical protein AAF108_06495 [Planctomycetota bacterium]
MQAGMNVDGRGAALRGGDEGGHASLDRALGLLRLRLNALRGLMVAAAAVAGALLAVGGATLLMRVGLGVEPSAGVLVGVFAAVFAAVFGWIGLGVARGFSGGAGGGLCWASGDGLAAFVDAECRLGGRLLAGGLSDGEASGLALTVERLRARPSGRGGWSLGWLASGMVLLVAAWLVPMGEPGPDAVVSPVAATVEELRDELETLRETDAAELEELERLEALIDDAERGGSGGDAHAAWESVDFASDELSKAMRDAVAELASLSSEAEAYESLFEAMSRDARSASGLAGAVAEALPQAMDGSALPEEMLQKLAEAAGELGEAGLSGERAAEIARAMARAAGECKTGAGRWLDAATASRLLDPDELDRLLDGGERAEAMRLLDEMLEACKNGGECDAAVLVACLRPGNGGVSRGPGHVELRYGEEADGQGALFESRRLASGAVDLEKSVLLGTAAMEPGDLTPGEASAGGSVGRENGSVSSSEIGVTLPVHRRAVRRYFERSARPGRSDDAERGGSGDEY